jgi:hypothetical protein
MTTSEKVPTPSLTPNADRYPVALPAARWFALYAAKVAFGK